MAAQCRCRPRNLKSFSRDLGYWAYNFVTKLEIITVRVLSLPCNQVSYCHCAGRARRPLTVWVGQVPFCNNWLHWLTGASARILIFVLPASDSVRHSFNLCLTIFVPPWLVLMTIPCSSRLILSFLHHQLVVSRAGLFAAYFAVIVRLLSLSRCADKIRWASTGSSSHLQSSETWQNLWHVCMERY